MMLEPTTHFGGDGKALEERHAPDNFSKKGLL